MSGRPTYYLGSKDPDLKLPLENSYDESRNLPSWKVVLSKMAVRNVRTLMNISRLMLQNTACRASAVSAIHNRHVSSLNRCPSVTNLLCQVRIHVVAPANVILKVAIFFWLSFYWISLAQNNRKWRHSKFKCNIGAKLNFDNSLYRYLKISANEIKNAEKIRKYYSLLWNCWFCVLSVDL